MYLDSIVVIVFIVFFLLERDAEDEGVAKVVDLEVVDGPVFQAVAVAQAKDVLAHADVGAQVVGHVQAVAPPSQVGEILVVA